MTTATLTQPEKSSLPMAKPRILIIEDERGLTEVLTYVRQLRVTTETGRVVLAIEGGV